MIALYIDATYAPKGPDEAFAGLRVLHVDDRLGSAVDRLEALILQEAERDCMAENEHRAKDWSDANLHVVRSESGMSGYVMLFGMTIGYYQLRSL